MSDKFVEFIMQAGNDYVKSKMNREHAEYMLENGKVKKTNQFEDYPYCVDGKYFFKEKPCMKQFQKN